jgi:hypothetical protein
MTQVRYSAMQGLTQDLWAAVQTLRHARSSMPQGLRHSARAVTHGASHLFCRSMQVFKQPGADAACAELVKATTASMAAINILIMDRVSSRFPKIGLSAV